MDADDDLPVERRRWKVFDYETEMWDGLHRLYDLNVVPAYPLQVRNAIIESLALHTRILCDLILKTREPRGRDKHDIRLHHMLPDFVPPSRPALHFAYYMDGADDSPCDQLNTRLAHPTIKRSHSHPWGVVLTPVWDAMEPCLDEIQAERESRGL